MLGTGKEECSEKAGSIPTRWLSFGETGGRFDSY